MLSTFLIILAVPNRQDFVWAQFQKSREKLLVQVKKSNILKERGPTELKKKLVEHHQINFHEKKLHSVFSNGTKDVKDEEGSWEWLKKG